MQQHPLRIGGNLAEMAPLGKCCTATRLRDQVAVLLMVFVYNAVRLRARTLWDMAAATSSDTLIVAGVWGEIHFGKKARIAGHAAQVEAEIRVAEALQKAAEADKLSKELESANLKLQATIAPRRIKEIPDTVPLSSRIGPGAWFWLNRSS
jgi:hypothetical protein